MTDPVDPLSDFDDLRRAGISYAQEASGEIWTDYNIHDPGVTLLEQTCFALSQIAYQVSLPTRDLLTNTRGHFNAQDLALFKPRRVLSTYPVTRHDLRAWLCDCPGIESVSIAAPTEAEAGLFHVTIVPSPHGAAHPDPETAFRAAFADVRPLCTNLGRVEIARPAKVALQGRVEINPEALPETAAAGLYHRIGQLLTGAHDPGDPATRADVWDAPERLLAPAQNRSAQSLDLTKHLARLRLLPGIRDIGSLTLKSLELHKKDAKSPVYFQVALPRKDDEIGITLTLDGAPVTLSAARLREEFIRISAETIAEATHHIDRLDWDVMKPGRHRRFAHSHVDALLPVLYKIPYGTKGGSDPAQLFDAYRGAIDSQLREMVDSLRQLPQSFTAAPDHAETDPVRHRLRRDLLDYLIALQGSAMPATRHSGLHRYMSTTARHRFEIAWRLEYLFALPTLKRGRATGPGPNVPGGFLAELAILCDLGLAETVDVLTDPLQTYGLTLGAEAVLAEDDASEKLMIVPAHNPFDMLVPEDASVEALDADALRDLTGFLTDGALSPELLARLTDPDCFAISPHMGGKWLVLMDPGEAAALRQITIAENKWQAQRTVNRLRMTWRQINHRAEAAHLIEHVMLGETRAGQAQIADLILPGYTARCAMASYRSYVENRVEALAPAHLYIRVHWLDPAELAEIGRLARAAKDGAVAEHRALREFLDARAAEAGR
ncbi:MAG: hypothetical protein AAF999_14090 [Pseudomonadota bacterium]